MPINASSIVAAAPPAKAKAQSATIAKTAAKTSDREEALNGLGQLIQAPLIATKQYADAGAMGMHWPNVSREVARLAETQSAIAKLIDPLLQVGPYAALITAVMPMVMQFAVNHGRVSPGAMGTVSKEHLESKIKTSLAQMELAMLREQQKAEDEAEEIRRQIAVAREE